MQHRTARLALALTTAAALTFGLGAFANAAPAATTAAAPAKPAAAAPAMAAKPAAATATTGAKLPGCRDATGKFVACPAKTADKPAAKCRDKTTKKFAKCDAPNTEPVPAKASPGATAKSAAKPN